MRVKRPFDNRNFKISTVKRLALVSALVAFSIGLPGICAAQGPDLDVLENKFFHHTYPKDTSEARIDRLEKMVFGEAKDGPERDRIDGLMKMVDEADDDQPVAERGTTSGGGSQSPASRTASGSGSSTAKKSAPAQTPEKAAREDDGTSYPAVSAIEKKVFGKDFSDEAVEDRLTRLEKKTFGQISKSNDLSERMDALKEKTGIDIARSSPQGADWNEEEDDSADYPEPSAPVARSYPGVSPRDSGRSFSGRDVGDDLNRAFGRRPGGSTGSGGSGSYGMGGGSQISSGGSGAYGFGGGSRSSGSGLNYSRGAGSGSSSSFGGKSSAGIIGSSDDDDGLPPAAPSIARRSAGAPLIASRPGVGEPPVAPPRGTAQGGGGLTLQLDALEGQVFGKSYTQEGLIQRLERLETTVFPGDRSAKSRTPAERIARLANVVPIGINPPQNISRNQPMDQDGDGSPDYDNSQIAQQQQLPQAQRSRGGLGKIINSLGNFLGGGMSVGSYGMPTGNLVTDPQTGMLVDQYSGNLINPSTGQVVGRKAGFGYQSPIPNYGVNFNNGFSSSPYTNPMYSNPAYGIGGSGLRFGSGMGGMGGVRFGGGMWP